LNKEPQPDQKKIGSGIISRQAILAGTLASLPILLWNVKYIWLSDLRYFSLRSLLPVTIGAPLVILALRALTSSNPDRWILNTLISFGVFLGSIILGVVCGLLFIPHTYGFLHGGLFALSSAIAGVSAYWLFKLFQRLTPPQHR
jgi:hypothetical protein